MRELLSENGELRSSNPLEKHELLIEKLRENYDDLLIIANTFWRDTNFLIYQVLSAHYIEEIVKLISGVEIILNKYEKICNEQIKSLKRVNKMILEVSYSKWLFELFSNFEKVAEEYIRNFPDLDYKYFVVRNLKKIKVIVKNLKILLQVIKKEVIEEVTSSYKKNSNFFLKPNATAKEVVEDAHTTMWLIKMVYYLLLKYLNKEVFDEQKVAEILHSCDEVVLSHWKNHKELIWKLMQLKWNEFKDNFFYEEFLKILEKATLLYIQKIDTFIWSRDVELEDWTERNIKWALENIKEEVRSVNF